MNKKYFFSLLFVVLCGQILYAPPLRRPIRKGFPGIVKPVVIGGGCIALWEGVSKLGYSRETHSIYSVTVKIDPRCSDRVLFSPNLAIILQIPGVGNVASSEYCNNYNGQRYCFFFIAPKASKGANVLLQVIDYKYLGFNKVFNNTLKSKVAHESEVGGVYEYQLLSGKLRVNTSIKGKVETQLLREHENVEVIVPGYMGTGEFSVPWFTETTNGDIKKNGQTVGNFSVEID